MTRGLHYLRRALSLPPHETVKRAARMIERRLRGRWRRKRDVALATYASSALAGNLGCFLAVPTRILLEPHRAVLDALAAHYVAHRFDLLGSGWVQVRHGMRTRGIAGCHFDRGVAVTPDTHGRWLQDRINPSNVSEAMRIWSLVDAGYQPIDWQVDFKSGFRWSECSLSVDIVPGRAPRGADIKVPWELARSQHLPQLALAYLAVDNRSEAQFDREFRNQVLDFAAQNPPRYGVNWVCTMDVAIRISNWLVAYDLFRIGGASFDSPFESIFARCVFEHARHIVANLEWHERFRSNHYLSNIVGLLFAAAYLPSDDETNAWLALAMQELPKEFKHQFNDDGSNFEASTSYHRLCTEMVSYGTAIATGLPRSRLSMLARVSPRRFPGGPRLVGPPNFLSDPGETIRAALDDDYCNRLCRAAEFTRDIARPNGTVPQIGDNDSGRFLRLPGTYDLITTRVARSRYSTLADYADLPDDACWPDENILDHRHVPALVDRLLRRNDRVDRDSKLGLEAFLVGTISRDAVRLGLVDADRANRMTIGSSEAVLRARSRLLSLPQSSRQSYRFTNDGSASLRDGLTAHAYPDFGLYILRSPRLHLAIRCGPLTAKGIGSHAHHDQLGVELDIDGEACVRDPGSYVYTPLPEARNRYRSARAHFAPRVMNEEPGTFEGGLFILSDRAAAQCHYFGMYGFVGEHVGFSCPVLRIIDVLDNAVIIDDGAIGGNLERCELSNSLIVSPKYGCLSH
ncbi:MAG: heparinase II/III family protein [Burkholderiales bacterium]